MFFWDTVYIIHYLGDSSYTCRIIANFFPNFVPTATWVSREKIRLAAFAGPSLKTPLQMQKSRRYLLHRPSYSQFCPKFRCHGNQGAFGVKLNRPNIVRLAIPESHTQNQQEICANAHETHENLQQFRFSILAENWGVHAKLTYKYQILYLDRITIVPCSRR